MFCAPALAACTAAAQDAIEQPLAAASGDPQRGRDVVFSREPGNCLLCHEIPGAGRPSGNVGPSLAGVGARLSAGQLRLRLVDFTRVKPDSVMPPYYRTQGLHAVAGPYRDRTLLEAQQIEDVIAFLRTLR
jgi:sulfur-oxidizing protein SoxX